MNSESSVQEAVHSNEENDLNIINKTCLYSFCNSSGKQHRFLALFFICWLQFGPYFCYDNPSALQDNILKDLNITSTQFSMLYSLYSWPAVVVCIVGGVLIDSFLGITLGSILYMGITLIGQIIFAVGAMTNAFWVMATGRFIFGLGAEPLAVAQSNYAVAWFKGKELNMVFGIQQSCSAIGSVLNFWIMDPLYISMSNFFYGHRLLGIVLLIASTTCVFSMICSIILGVIHKNAENILRQNGNNIPRAVTLTDIKNFRCSFWLLILISVTFYIAIYPFFSLSKVFFMDTFNMTSTSANRLNSMLYFVSVFGAPLLGYVVDKVGRNIFWLIVAVLCTIIGHITLAFFSWTPYIGVIMMSIASSIIASTFYPIIALVIPENQLGTAYGLCWSIQNLFMGIATILSGVIVDHVGYIWLEVFFIASSTVSLIATVILLVLDAAQSGILNMTTVQRQLHQHLQPAAAASSSEENLLATDAQNSSEEGESDQSNANLEVSVAHYV